MKSLKAGCVSGCLVLGILSISSFAGAQQQPKQPAAAAGSNVLQVGEITIVGRVAKPIASVDVSKIQPKLTLAELRQPFLDRIEEVIMRDPF